VLAYIEEHLAEDIAVADLANVACLSIFHFTRAFAATTGVPPHRYVSQRRLETARAMITTGRASLSQIAYDCRFSSQSSFTRAFRRGNGRDTGQVPTNVAIAFLGRAHPSHDHATIGGATRARCRCSRVRQTSR
jgi:AraC family transcriptional regulator